MDDYSINSSLAAAASKGTTEVAAADELQEESGWTAYFEDFDEQQHSYSSSFSCSSSMISDAATTGAAWKLSHSNKKTHHHHVFACSSAPKVPTKLRFKKTRTKEISQEADDSLEDTASSPVNSPKVSEVMKFNDTNPRKLREDQIHGCLGIIKDTGSENYSEIQQIDQEERKLKFVGQQHHGMKNNNNDCTDQLKKRGLCLVPFSMLVNYLG